MVALLQPQNIDDDPWREDGHAVADYSEKLNASNFFEGMLSVFWAELSYGASIAMTLQLLDSGSNASIALLVVIGSVLAQVWSSMQLTVAERLLDRPIHYPNCRAFQACHAFVAWTMQLGIFAGGLAAVFTYVACPQWLLWLPILKRPAGSDGHPQSASRTSNAKRRRNVGATVLQSRRYTPEFWGLAWVSKRGANNNFSKMKAAASTDSSAKQQFELDCAIDHAACRQLLLKLDTAEVRQRLVALASYKCSGNC